MCRLTGHPTDRRSRDAGRLAVDRASSQHVMQTYSGITSATDFLIDVPQFRVDSRELAVTPVRAHRWARTPLAMAAAGACHGRRPDQPTFSSKYLSYLLCSECRHVVFQEDLPGSSVVIRTSPYHQQVS